MPHRTGAILGKYKHIIVIAVALAAVGSYFLPPNIFVFAAPNHANSAARDSILKGLSHSASSSSAPHTSSTTKAAGSKASADPGTGNTGTGNTGNLNSGNGNIGNLNSGNGNIGNQNPGSNNIGNHNPGNGFIGNNCGSGSGHYTCVKNGKIVRG
jgi:PPE-repeat protein